jgi:hypothetical protein
MKYLCPSCDHDVEVGLHCSHCAKPRNVRKPAQKSWEQDASADGLDLPDDDFDYDAFVAEEFGTAPHRKTGLAWHWYVVALLLLIAMLLGIFR